MSATGSTLPARARTVIIGGGVIGTSIAYHLGHLGVSDVVLLERDRLTSGTTWHAAGLMTCFGSLSETSMGMRMYTRDLYARLESETGQSTGFRPVGFIEVAADQDRLEEYRRVAAFNRHVGLEVHEISPAEVRDLFPLADTSDLLAGVYVPGDGRVNPVDVTMALAKGARAQGVSIVEGVTVEEVLTQNHRVVGVRTSQGDIECEQVVNAAGMWARQLGERSGVAIPLQAAEHYYLITEEMAEVHAALPILEDPARHGYYREEGGGLMVGLFEPVCAPWSVGGIPDDFSFGQITPDWERMGPFVERAMSRVPATLDVGVRTFFCGPESFTPDLSPIVGPAPGLDGYFVAAGMNSVGILTGGGLGRIVAQWIVDGRPDVDVTGFAIDRMADHQLTPRYRAERTVETLGMVYAAHLPGRAMSTARGIRRSPLHDRLSSQGAYFRDVSGWEGADWYAGPDVVADPGALTWGRPEWFDVWAAEHRAIREGVGLMDMSFMSDFAVTGPDAGAFLDRLSTARVDGESGVITYTQWLNESGTIEADLTVTKREEGSFLVVASDTARGHVAEWMRRHRAGFDVDITDVTSGIMQINLQGPLSREVLQRVTSVDMSDAAFGFRAARTIDVGLAPVLCARITYLGELGYELHVPTELALHVYEQLLEAGADSGLCHVGLKALASLRLEKGYRDYGHDIDNTDSLLEVGLGFTVDEAHDFIGRAAWERQRSAGPPRRRLMQLLLQDPEPMLHHGEIVYRDGVAVGDVRAGSYGHTLGGAVGLAMVEASESITPDVLAASVWEVDIAGRRWPVTASLRPLYDPTNARIRA
jgi:glycine cleavage system aminomethyltransferase T/glycine/D-amino acid oxidase-like deaminating enzyme